MNPSYKSSSQVMNPSVLRVKYGVMLLLFMCANPSFAQSKKELTLTYQQRFDSLEFELNSCKEKCLTDLESLRQSREVALREIERLEARLNGVNVQLEAMTSSWNLEKIENQRLQNDIQVMHDSMLVMLNEIEDKNKSMARGQRQIDSLDFIIEQLIEDGLRNQLSVQDIDETPVFAIDERYRGDKNALHALLQEVLDEFLFVDAASFTETLVQDEIIEYSDEHRTSWILLTDDYLIASYVMSFGNDYGTKIIDLNSFKDVLDEFTPGFYLSGVESDNRLSIVRSGYEDGVGRYWQYGTYDIQSHAISFGDREYE